MEHKRYVELERLRKGTHVPARPKRIDEPNVSYEGLESNTGHFQTNMIQDLEVFCKKTVDRIADDLILLDGLHGKPNFSIASNFKTAASLEEIVNSIIFRLGTSLYFSTSIICHFCFSDQIYSEPMMFVGVSTSYFNFDKINGDMYPLPLEMSTIVFNLKEGIKSVDTVDFNLDPLVVLQPHSEEALEKVREKINSEGNFVSFCLYSRMLA